MKSQIHGRGAVLVTGASTGIGKACALRLDRAGFLVFAGVLSEPEGAELRRLASPRLQILVLDIRDESAIHRAVARISAATGEAGILALVNNAGVLGCAPLEVLSMSEVRQVFEVNVIGQIAVTQAFLPLLRRARKPGRKSRIINIGSLAGRSALPFTSPYNASKFALRALNDTWRLELRNQGIAVVLIEPGLVATPIWQKGSDFAAANLGAISPQLRERHSFFVARTQEIAQIAQKRGASPDAVARCVGRAVESPRPRPRYTIGKEARLVLAVEKLPTPWRDWLVARRLL